MTKVKGSCQSCSMPLNKDTAPYYPNKIYCSNCFDGKNFVNPSMTLKEMEDLVKSKLIEMGFPKFIAGFFTKGIKNLPRWKNK